MMVFLEQTWLCLELPKICGTLLQWKLQWIYLLSRTLNNIFFYCANCFKIPPGQVFMTWKDVDEGIKGLTSKNMWSWHNNHGLWQAANGMTKRADISGTKLGQTRRGKFSLRLNKNSLPAPMNWELTRRPNQNSGGRELGSSVPQYTRR